MSRFLCEVWCTHIVNIVRDCVVLTVQNLAFSRYVCQMHKPQIKQLMIKMHFLYLHK